MIGYLEGTVVLVKSGSVVVNVNNVGYEVFLPQRILLEQTAGKKAAFYIHTHLTENNLRLYGFGSNEELNLFELLLNVSGIGPKNALAVLNYGVEKVKQAITQAEVNFFTQIPRLGTKNAQKIIIELKNKIGAIRELDLKMDGQNKELTDTLGSMGFSRSEIVQVLQNMPVEIKALKEQIRFALKILAKK